MRTAATRPLILAALITLAGLLALAAPAGAVPPGPAWSIESLPFPTNFPPGEPSEPGEGEYEVQALDATGIELSSAPATIIDTLPKGLVVTGLSLGGIEEAGSLPSKLAEELCAEDEPKAEVARITCTIPAVFKGNVLRRESVNLKIVVVVPEGVPEGPVANSVSVKGAGAAPAEASSANRIDSTPAPQGFNQFSARVRGEDGTVADPAQAGSRPLQYVTGFALNTEINPPTELLSPSGGATRNIEVSMPPGFVGNPTAVGECTAQLFIVGKNGECPASSAVGYVSTRIEGQRIVAPIYNLVPPEGMPAQLGFRAAFLPYYIDTSVRSGTDYGIDAGLSNLPTVERPLASKVVLWGEPASHSHDRVRGACLSPLGNSLGSCSAEVVSRPFLRMPTSCDSPLPFTIGVDLWDPPHPLATATSTQSALVGCGALQFNPTISLTPDTTVSDSAAGVTVDLHLPQNEASKGLATADLNDVTVNLPEGVTVNPSSANGLASCSASQIGLTSAVGAAPVTFTPDPATCPDAAKVGSLSIHTPLLDHPIDGSIYVADQGSGNPFNSLIALYFAAYDQKTGVVVKLAGRISLDQTSGRITAIFANNPQVPFEDLQTVFFAGPRAALRTPFTCGTYTTTTDMKPWSAPYTGPDATPSDSFSVSGAPGGGPCVGSEGQAPNKPAFEAGTSAPVAGAYSPFVLNLKRDDGSQNFTGLKFRLPKGLIGKQAGVPFCSDAALASAASRPGRDELASPSCPAASQIGTVDVAAGAGPMPLHVQGKVYLTGPYKGAPLSAAVITPAVAGPFDVGTVVVRSELQVDPVTAEVTAVTDPLPTILQGIPLDVRSISLSVDKPEFMLNPTSCATKSIGGEEISKAAQAASLSSRFEVGGCRGLEFKPRIYTRLFGGTKRGQHPRFRAILMGRPGQANFDRMSVTLPRSEFLENAHIRTICTRVQYAAGNCPAGSIYGHVEVITPLLDVPLEGPVYLRSSNHKLPDLVLALHGPPSLPVKIELAGRIDSIHGGIRTTFTGVPDAPLTKGILTMKGAKKGLLVNSRNICAHTYRSKANFVGQNGRPAKLRPMMQNSRCGKKTKRKHKRHHRTRR